MVRNYILFVFLTSWTSWFSCRLNRSVKTLLIVAEGYVIKVFFFSINANRGQLRICSGALFYFTIYLKSNIHIGNQLWLPCSILKFRNHWYKSIGFDKSIGHIELTGCLSHKSCLHDLCLHTRLRSRLNFRTRYTGSSKCSTALLFKYLYQI